MLKPLYTSTFVFLLSFSPALLATESSERSAESGDSLAFTVSNTIYMVSTADAAIVALARRGLVYSENRDVQRLAGDLMSEHSRAKSLLVLRASKDGYQIKRPFSTPVGSEAPHQSGSTQFSRNPEAIANDIMRRQSERIEMLDAIKGPSFDREFTTMMARDHAELIENIERAMPSIHDDLSPKMLREITDLLSILREFRQRAAELSREHGGNPESDDDSGSTD